MVRLSLISVVILLSVNAHAAGKNACGMRFNADFSEVTFVPSLKTPEGRKAQPLSCRIAGVKGSNGVRLLLSPAAEVELTCGDTRLKQKWIFNSNYGVLLSEKYKIKFADGYECLLTDKVTLDNEGKVVHAPESFQDLKISGEGEEKRKAEAPSSAAPAPGAP